MWGIIATISAIVVFLYFFKRLKDAPKATTPGPFSLETKPEIGPAETTRLLLNATNTGTIQAFVYPLQPQKTGTVVLCNPAGSANPGEPNCSTGQYALCKCQGNDCSKCIHSGYVNVMNISNVIRVEILTAPDASRQKASAAQLVVRTVGMATPVLTECPIPNSQLPNLESELGTVKACCNAALVSNQCPGMTNANLDQKLCLVGDADSIPNPYLKAITQTFRQCSVQTPTKVQTTFEETIPLPEIPLQKWTMVTVAREGRRFDVYYNGKLVASKRTQYLVDSRSGFGPIVAGDPSLTGKIALVESFPQKLSEHEVMEKYKANSDTTGKPNLPDSFNVMDYLPNCKGGDCVKLPALRPASPLLDWQVQYA